MPKDGIDLPYLALIQDLFICPPKLEEGHLEILRPVNLALDLKPRL